MNINYQMYHFGPQLLRFDNLSVDLIERLKSDSKTLYEDHRHNLAGQIADEKSFSEDQRRLYDDLLRPYFDAYMYFVSDVLGNSVFFFLT